jgi:hypothetical protein
MHTKAIRALILAALCTAAAVVAHAQEVDINCGGASFTGSDGTNWSADQYFSGGDLLYSGNSISNTSDLQLYRSARAGLYGDFTYTIPVANGAYNLSLLFAEIQYSNPGDRVFNVLVNGSPVLTNFDIAGAVGPNVALTKTFAVTVSTGAVQISVVGVTRRGILNGIRVVPTGPSGGPPTPPPPAGASVVSINCGGSAMTGLDGTVWSADAYFTGGDLAYTSYPIAGASDLYLYRTARRGLYGNFSYSIPLANSSYVLKLKFAEIMLGGKGQRIFNVNVNGTPVLSNFDIVADAGPLTADDKTFPVTVTNGILQIDVIGVTGYGILNGIQVLAAGSTPPPTPTLSLSTSSMSFGGVAGAANPAAQIATVSTTAAWTAASNQNWLTVSPASGAGSGSLSIAANLAGLAAGPYPATVTVTAPGATGSPQAMAVNLTVAAAPVTPGVSVTPAGLNFSATAGGANPSSQAVTISNSGGGTLSWTAAKTQPWLVLGATSGSGVFVLSVQAIAGSLAAGTYTDTITISAAGANPASQTVSVTFTVAPAAPVTPPSTPLISINCGGSTMTGADGTNWAADQYFTGGDLIYTGYLINGTQDLYLYRTARRGLYGNFSYSIPVPNGSYTLKLKFAEIAYGSTGQRVFNVNVNGAPVLTNFDIVADAGALTADDKLFPVTVANGALQIDVIGVVGFGLLNGIQVLPAGGGSTPTLTVSSSTASFSGTAGAANPAAQSIGVTTTAAWTAASNQSWLTVSPASGTGNGNLTLNANIAGLAAGTYNANVTITATGAAGSPKTVAATLTVTAAAPAITSFTATPATITAGQSATLSWATANAAGASIDQGIGAVAASGSATVSPASTTTYTLTATNAAGTATRTVTLPVGSATPPSGGNSGNTDQWQPNSNPPQTYNPNGGQVLYNGIQLPAAWPPIQGHPDLHAASVHPESAGGHSDRHRPSALRRRLPDRLHQPHPQPAPGRWYPGNPVMSPGSGWDTQGNAFPYSDGVWYDPADQKFKIWYFGGQQGNQMCYAWSADGVNWIKPAIADAAVPNTNVVLVIWGGRDTTTVWMDLHDTPARKFKAFVTYSNGPGGAYVLDIFFSPDGIHWTGPQAVTPPALSDRTTAFYNPFRGVWVDSARNPADYPAAPTRAAYHSSRERWYSESSDLQVWTPSDPSTAYWTGTDERDPAYPGTTTVPQLYNLDAVPYESLMVGMFSWYYPNVPDLVELGMGFSRDGFNWVRPTRGGGPNNAFVPAADLPNTWNGYNTQSAGGAFLVVGDQLYFYFSGRNYPHGQDASATRQTGLAKLRRDGFYSMDAGASQGILTTRPVKFSGSHVFVNVAAPSGQLQVEVLDANGNVIPAFARANSSVVSADTTRQEVAWSGANVGSLAGQTVSFRFYLTNGQLYSFWVASSANGASNGYVGANGPGFTADTDTVGNGAK